MFRGFERFWGLKVQSRVHPLPVVKDLDVFKNAPLGFLTRPVFALVHQLDLHRFEEGFHGSIVPAVAFAAHTLTNAMPVEKAAIGF